VDCKNKTKIEKRKFEFCYSCLIFGSYICRGGLELEVSPAACLQVEVFDVVLH